MNYYLNCINIKVLIYDNYIAYTHVSMAIYRVWL